jgi:hypothetical protein
MKNFYHEPFRSEWSSPQNALAYLNVADNLPHRSEGESVLIDHLPENTGYSSHFIYARSRG